MNKRWAGIKGLDGDYDEENINKCIQCNINNTTLLFDYKKYRLYEELCELCYNSLF